MPTQQGDDEHPRRHQSCWLGSLCAKLVVRLRCPGREIVGEWCMAAVATKKEEEEQEVTIPTTGKSVPRSIMAVAIILWPPWVPTPGF
jgi:hypothetical protein